MRHYIVILGFVFYASMASAKPLFIFMGGFGSCALNGHTSELKATEQMDAMIHEAQAAYGSDVLNIRSCYALGSSSIYVTAPSLNLESVQMTRPEFHNVVKRAAQDAGDDAPIYAWGQSHGGWTAMDLVRSTDHLKYRMLITVDPISIPECGPAIFTGGTLSGSAPGCRGAPRDLEDSYTLIRSRVNHWTNWYQKEFSLLHSDRIHHATENFERFFNASWWVIMGAHRLTETDDIMWQDATKKVVTDIQKLGM